MANVVTITPKQLAERADRAILRCAKVLADLSQQPDALAACYPYMVGGGTQMLREWCDAFDAAVTRIPTTGEG